MLRRLLDLFAGRRRTPPPVTRSDYKHPAHGPLGGITNHMPRVPTEGTPPIPSAATVLDIERWIRTHVAAEPKRVDVYYDLRDKLVVIDLTLHVDCGVAEVERAIGIVNEALDRFCPVTLRPHVSLVVSTVLRSS